MVLAKVSERYADGLVFGGYWMANGSSSKC
jgi:hypothetical protein